LKRKANDLDESVLGPFNSIELLCLITNNSD